MPDFDLGTGGAVHTAGTSTGQGGAGGYGGIGGAGTGGYGSTSTGGAAGQGGVGGQGGIGGAGAGGYGGTSTGGAAGQGGVGGQGGSGGAPTCDPACPAPKVPACETITCSGVTCESAFQADGKVLSSQVKGDCHVAVCDGQGGTKQQVDNSDYDDGIACTDDACNGGIPSHFASAAGGSCAQNGGKVCDLSGRCVACLVTPDCADANKVCDANLCVPLTCNDAMKDVSETDVDCGGPDCAPCDDAKWCLNGTDCKSQICDAGKLCAKPTCMDGVKNGNETDLDCGGGMCSGCGDGKHCTGMADCSSGTCDLNLGKCVQS